MARRCAGNRLVLAGVIVTLLGLAVALTATLAIPRHWTTVGVGLALLVAGLARRTVQAREHS